MVLEVPVDEMLILSSPISLAEYTNCAACEDGGALDTAPSVAPSPASLEELLASSDKDWFLDLEGEIRRMTVPTACKVEPVMECFLDDGCEVIWMTLVCTVGMHRTRLKARAVSIFTSFGVCAAVDTIEDEPELAVLLPMGTDGTVLVVADAEAGSGLFVADPGGEGTSFRSMVGRRFTSFRVFLNLKVFLLCAFCLCSLVHFSWKTALSALSLEVLPPPPTPTSLAAPAGLELMAETSSPGSESTDCLLVFLDWFFRCRVSTVVLRNNRGSEVAFFDCMSGATETNGRRLARSEVERARAWLVTTHFAVRHAHRTAPLRSWCAA